MKKLPEFLKLSIKLRLKTTTETVTDLNQQTLIKPIYLLTIQLCVQFLIKRQELRCKYKVKKSLDLKLSCYCLTCANFVIR